MSKLLILFFTIIFWPMQPLQAASLKPFTTDYCTMFVEGTWYKPNAWKECCFAHDLRYWFGGEKSEMNKSDLILKECVRKKAGSFWANLMYYSVRGGHYSPVKSKYKWGWGWDESRHFQALSEADKQYIKEELNSLKLEETFLEKFILDYQL